jgi:hypothetical protein
MNAMRRLLLILGVVGLASLPALAHGPTTDIDFYFAVNVPTDLPLAGGTTTVLPWTLARHQTPAAPPDYTLSLVPAGGLTLPIPTTIDACHLLNGGDWLFSVEAPMDDPTGVARTFLPGDIARYDGATYTLFFDGVGVGLADGVNVDAAFIRYQDTIDGPLFFQKDNGNLVLSFDVPTDIAGVTYFPADLVEFSKTFPGPAGWAVVGRYFDSAAAGIPPSTNVTGADERGGVGTMAPHKAIVTFDVPTNDPAGPGALFLPGDLASVDPVPAAPAVDPGPYHRDPAWMAVPAGAYDSWGSRINALCFLASPGQIPCIPPNKLELQRLVADGSSISLTWSASCSVGAEDYGIHEGSLPASPGAWVYNHDDIDCSDGGGDFTETVTTAAGNTYYLVVPWNANDEGSYGQKSAPPLPLPAERPASTPAPNCDPNPVTSRELSCP